MEPASVAGARLTVLRWTMPPAVELSTATAFTGPSGARTDAWYPPAPPG